MKDLEFCKHCGAELHEGATFCGRCGESTLNRMGGEAEGAIHSDSGSSSDFRPLDFGRENGDGHFASDRFDAGIMTSAAVDERPSEISWGNVRQWGTPEDDGSVDFGEKLQSRDSTSSLASASAQADSASSSSDLSQEESARRAEVDKLVQDWIVKNKIDPNSPEGREKVEKMRTFYLKTPFMRVVQKLSQVETVRYPRQYGRGYARTPELGSLVNVIKDLGFPGGESFLPNAKFAVSRPDGRLGIPRNKYMAMLLLVCGGLFGFHKFYEGKLVLGILYLCTGGFLCVALIVDFIVLLTRETTYYLDVK